MAVRLLERGVVCALTFHRWNILRLEPPLTVKAEQIEKVMYRAFTQLMPSNATYAVARAATIQSARDLYGAGSAAERAVTQAWTAVGVD